MVLSPPLTNMKIQNPLYQQVNHGYNALTFGGNDNAYYKINSGPYNQPCSLNKARSCTGQTLSEEQHAIFKALPIEKQELAKQIAIQYKNNPEKMKQEFMKDPVLRNLKGSCSECLLPCIFSGGVECGLCYAKACDQGKGDPSCCAGPSCIASSQLIETKSNGLIMVKDLKPGNYVKNGDSYDLVYFIQEHTDMNNLQHL